MKQKIVSFSLYLAWVVSLVATLFSLYYSEIEKLPPCNLCWYQRICLFPLVIILGLAAYREERKIAFYLYPQIAIGFLFGLTHLLYPYWNPWGSSLCGTTSCYEPSHTFLGLPLPFWSMATFFVIGAFLKIGLQNQQRS